MPSLSNDAFEWSKFIRFECKGFTPYLYLYNVKYQNASLKKTKAFLILIQKLFQFPGQLLQFLRLSLEQSVSLWTPSSIVLPESKLVGSWWPWCMICSPALGAFGLHEFWLARGTNDVELAAGVDWWVGHLIFLGRFNEEIYLQGYVCFVLKF